MPRAGILPPEASAALASVPAGTGIACYNDDVASALLGAAHKRGLRVPDDIAIIGMDRTPLSQVTVPRLTTLSYDLTAGSRSLMSLMLAELPGEEPAYSTADSTCAWCLGKRRRPPGADCMGGGP